MRRKGGYWAEVPALDGCFSQGETIEELLDDASGAITTHLDALESEGIPAAPPESILVATVAVGRSIA
jgi:predicted RNase H-like HicB family nuclease